MKLTQEDIESVIVHEQYHVFPGTTVTVCCLTLLNGFNAVGESACVDPKNFNAEMGRKIARDNAFDVAWKVEGYLLKQRMFEESRASDS